MSWRRVWVVSSWLLSAAATTAVIVAFFDTVAIAGAGWPALRNPYPYWPSLILASGAVLLAPGPAWRSRLLRVALGPVCGALRLACCLLFELAAIALFLPVLAFLLAREAPGAINVIAELLWTAAFMMGAGGCLVALRRLGKSDVNGGVASGTQGAVRIARE